MVATRPRSCSITLTQFNNHHSFSSSSPSRRYQSEQVLPALAGGKGIVCVDISHNNLGDRAAVAKVAQVLSNLKSLQVLDLCDCQWTQPSMEELERALMEASEELHFVILDLAAGRALIKAARATRRNAYLNGVPKPPVRSRPLLLKTHRCLWP